MRRGLPSALRRSLPPSCSITLSGRRARIKHEVPLGTSGFQIPFLELLCRRAERAELIYGRACRREGEGLKRFGQHLVEVCFRRDASADMRIEVFAAHLRHERRHVLDDGRIGGGIVVPGSERADGAGLHGERGHRGDNVSLQLEDFRLRSCAATRHHVLTCPPQFRLCTYG